MALRKKIFWFASCSLICALLYYIHQQGQISDRFSPPPNAPPIVWSRPLRSMALSIRFSPDGKYLLIAGSTGSGKLEQDSSGDYTLDFSLGDKRLRLWDVAQNRELERLKTKPIFGEWNGYHMLLMPDFKTLVSTWGARKLIVADIRKRRPDRVVYVNNGYISSLAVSPDAKTLAIGMTGEVQFRDAHTFRLLKTYEHGGQGTQVGFGSNPHIVRCSWSGMKPHFVDVRTGKWIPAPRSTRDFDVTHSPDGEYFADIVNRNTIELWKSGGAKSRKLQTWQSSLVKIDTLQFSPDGSTLAAAGLSSTTTPVQFFEVTTKNPSP